MTVAITGEARPVRTVDVMYHATIFPEEDARLLRNATAHEEAIADAIYQAGERVAPDLDSGGRPEPDAPGTAEENLSRLADQIAERIQSGGAFSANPIQVRERTQDTIVQVADDGVVVVYGDPFHAHLVPVFEEGIDNGLPGDLHVEIPFMVSAEQFIQSGPTFPF